MLSIPVLPTFIDESADETRSSFIVLAPCLAARKCCWRLTELWLKKLREVDVEYFRVTDCKSVSGPFRKLLRKHGGFDQAKSACDGLQTDLENIRLHPI